MRILEIMNTNEILHGDHVVESLEVRDSRRTKIVDQEIVSKLEVHVEITIKGLYVEDLDVPATW